MFAQMVLVASGIWLMTAPAVLDYGEPATTSDRIAGPVMAATAFLAIFAITRGLRWFNLAVGIWLLIAPWLLGFPTDAMISSSLCGLAALVLAPVGRLEQDKYGGGWLSLVRGDAAGGGNP